MRSHLLPPVSLVVLIWFCGSISAAEETRAVYETEIDADVAAVWDAFTTAKGLRAWMAPLVEIELQVGGKMKANYNPQGAIGDGGTIENTILAFDPQRMLSLQASKFPDGFPFAEAAQGTWSVFYFSSLPENRTKLTVVGLGYTAEPQSQQLRSIFADANRRSLEQLKKALKKAAESSAKP